jgi:hypothetical protein
MSAAAIVAPAGIDRPGAELGEVLSPSQVGTFLDCSAKYWYKHGLGLPDPAGASAVRGQVVHRTIADWFRVKRDGGELVAFDDTWEQAAAGAVWHAGEDPAVTKQQAATLVMLYVNEAGHAIEPAEIEKPVAGTIAGVPVRGIIDVLDVDGRVIDLKTSGRKPSTVAPDFAFQVGTYVALEAKASGAARIDTLVAKKEPELITLTVESGAADRRMVERLYPHVREGIREGLFFPNRKSTYCSRRHCNFWQECEAEFGGKVK